MDIPDQVVLEPDREYDPAKPDAYVSAKWRHSYNGKTSKWFPTRDDAHGDAEATYPGIGIG